MERGNVNEATPRPWRHGADWNHPKNRRIYGADFAQVAKIYAEDFSDRRGKGLADAALIVEAVNAHDRLARMAEAGAELVEALGAFSDAAKARDLYVDGNVSRAMALVYEKQHAYEEASRALPDA